MFGQYMLTESVKEKEEFRQDCPGQLVHLIGPAPFPRIDHRAVVDQLGKRLFEFLET